METQFQISKGSPSNTKSNGNSIQAPAILNQMETQFQISKGSSSSTTCPAKPCSRVSCKNHTSYLPKGYIPPYVVLGESDVRPKAFEAMFNACVCSLACSNTRKQAWIKCPALKCPTTKMTFTPSSNIERPMAGQRSAESFSFPARGHKCSNALSFLLASKPRFSFQEELLPTSPAKK